MCRHCASTRELQANLDSAQGLCQHHRTASQFGQCTGTVQEPENCKPIWTVHRDCASTTELQANLDSAQGMCQNQMTARQFGQWTGTVPAPESLKIKLGRIPWTVFNKVIYSILAHQYIIINILRTYAKLYDKIWLLLHALHTECNTALIECPFDTISRATRHVYQLI